MDNFNQYIGKNVEGARFAYKKMCELFDFSLEVKQQFEDKSFKFIMFINSLMIFSLGFCLNKYPLQDVNKVLLIISVCYFFCLFLSEVWFVKSLKTSNYYPRGTASKEIWSKECINANEFERYYMLSLNMDKYITNNVKSNKTKSKYYNRGLRLFLISNLILGLTVFCLFSF